MTVTIVSQPAPSAVAPWAGSALALIDGVIQDRVLVYGSPPPEGSDLDLLARPAQLSAIRQALMAVGFVQAGDVLARFRDGGCEMVELTPADGWGLPQGELADLFAAARPIDGMEQVARPSAHHALLIQARKAARGPAAFRKAQLRKRAACDDTPDVWRRAAEHAPAWQARQALALLKMAGEANGKVPRLAWWRARAERLNRRDGHGAWGGWRAARALLPRVRRTYVVSFSGLDGSGKSTQVQLLHDALVAAGQDTEVIWVGIGSNRSLRWIKAPVKRVLRMLPRVGPLKEVADRAAPRSGDDKPASLAEPGQRERRHGLAFRVVTQVWLSVMALTNLYTSRKVVLRAFGRGRVIIFDRYTLDSAVRLRHWYGDSLVYRLVIGLVHLLIKRPLKAYFLNVPPRIAYERKPEWEMNDFASRALLYDDEYAWLGVRRLDGTRPPDELSAQIAAEVWCALRQRDRR